MLDGRYYDDVNIDSCNISVRLNVPDGICYGDFSLF